MKDFFISYNKADRAWAEWIQNNQVTSPAQGPTIKYRPKS